MRYTTFGSQAIPDYDGKQEMGGDEALSAYVALPGRRSYDVYGSSAAPVDGAEITLTGAFLEASATALDTALLAWRALVGTRNTLTLTLASTASRTRLARLEAFETSDVPGPTRTQDFSMTFRLLGDRWRGTYHDGTGDDLVTLNASPKAMEIGNDGNVTVQDVTITLTAGSANITAVTIANAETGHVSSITYTGTITAGQALVIVTGSWSVKNNGTDDYAHLSAESTHAINGLLELAPGDNTITVTLTGGSTDSTISFKFYDGWA